MQKHLLQVLTLLLAFSLTSVAKEKEEFKEILTKDEATGEYYYEAVVPVEGVAKEEMFKRAKSWVISNLKTNDNNIDANEKDMSIINTASLVLDPTKGSGITSGNCNFKLNVMFKEGRYRLRFDNIVISVIFVTSNGSALETASYAQFARRENKAMRRFKQMVNEKMLAVAEGLDQAIKNNNSSEKKDW